MSAKRYISDHEEWLIDWDYDENFSRGLFPGEISLSSRKRVYWKCHICGGSWNTVVKERRGCPYCNHYKVLPGYNDLRITHPELVKEWDMRRNKIKPDEVSAGSHKKAFWICENNHHWEAQINSRVKGRQKKRALCEAWYYLNSYSGIRMPTDSRYFNRFHPSKKQ